MCIIWAWWFGGNLHSNAFKFFLLSYSKSAASCTVFLFILWHVPAAATNLNKQSHINEYVSL